MLVNRQPLKRARDLLGVLRVTVFAPDDLELVKGGPAERRRYLDDALVASHPRYDALRGEVDKILKQRNALLKSAGGRLDADAAFTLDVWDAKLVESGGRLAEARQALLDRLAPVLARDLRRRRQPARPRSTAAYVGRLGRRRARGGARRQPHATTCAAACPPSAPTATTSTCASAACRPAPTPRRASSGRSPSRCAWRRTT